MRRFGRTVPTRQTGAGVGSGADEKETLGLLADVVRAKPRGLKNPRFDRKTGDLWLGDVGQNK